MRTTASPNWSVHRSPGSFHPDLPIQRLALVRGIAALLGAGLIAVGLTGFVSPGAMGMHLGLTHNVIHLVSGVASLYFSLLASPTAASAFCAIFGVAYGALAAAGFALGGPEPSTMTGIVHGMDSRLLQVIPGTLELGTRDHVLHAAIGFAYLVASILGHPSSPPERRSHDGARSTRTPPPPIPPIPPLL